MKFDKRNLLIILLAFIVLALSIAATYRREYSVHIASYRRTVLTSAQTTVTLPDYFAQEFYIVNRGTGTVYIKWGSGVVNLSTDTKLKSGEATPVMHLPWTTIEMLAETSSAEVEILVGY